MLYSALRWFGCMRLVSGSLQFELIPIFLCRLGLWTLKAEDCLCLGEGCGGGGECVKKKNWFSEKTALCYREQSRCSSTELLKSIPVRRSLDCD